jgi:L,D-transpeptidase YbiS
MPTIDVDIAAQELVLIDVIAGVSKVYRIASAKNGVGELNGSNRTPRGRHVIRAKIGASCQENTVFVGRRPTGEMYSPALRAQHPNRDWILTRILWLSGCEAGFNRLGNVDTMRRYIYIHGTPDEVPMGVPVSHGCILLHNCDMIDLFDRVTPGTSVNIL